VLGDVGDSELIVMHDVSAGGIPYEAIGWDVNGKRFTPATQRRNRAPSARRRRAARAGRSPGRAAAGASAS